MSFQEAIQSVFQKYICFSGRARRSEYWYFALLNWAVSAVLTAIARNFDSSLASLFLTLWNIGVFLPGLGVCWRRLHDIGRSGAWYFLNLIPLVGQIILLIWLCKDASPAGTSTATAPSTPPTAADTAATDRAAAVRIRTADRTRMARTTARITAAATGSPDEPDIFAKRKRTHP